MLSGQPKTMFILALLGVALISFSPVMGESPPVPTTQLPVVEISCFWNLMTLDIGDTIEEGCETCTCTSRGKL